MSNRKRRRHEMEDDDIDVQDNQNVSAQNDFLFLFFTIAISSVLIATECDYLLQIPHPLIPDLRFHPDNLGTAATLGLQAEHLFRFSTDQLFLLVNALRLPNVLRTPQRDSFHSIEGLCIMLRRLVFPTRYMDLVQLFGRSRAALSRINRYMMAWLYMRWHHLSEFDSARVLPVADLWSNAVAEKAPDAYEHVMMFLDGHLQFTCRPCPAPERRPPGLTADDFQRAQYCYYKHHHGFKCHALISPSGMCVHYYGKVT